MLALAPLSVALAALAGLAITSGCGLPRGTDAATFGDAAAVATRLFEVARSADAEARHVPDFFVAPPDGAAAAALHDVLDELARVEGPRVLAVEPIDGPDRVAVDVLGSPASGGTARYSLHLARRAGTWKVEWISGPALSWPARAAGSRGPGLSSSHTEGGAGRAW